MPGGEPHRVISMACLIVAGEAIFGLPFHVARYFRPTVLDVFGLTHTELGAAQAVYGVVAMLAYFPGGLIADRVSARKLLVASLLSTAAGGVYFASLPPYQGMWLLFAWWGLTTILLFWAALIRATREWGGSDAQGRAYGVLDGGRGLFAAAFAAAAVVLFQTLMPGDPSGASNVERALALRGIIYAYTGVTVVAAAMCWAFVPDDEIAMAQDNTARRRVGTVFRSPTMWLQALIVVCAYVGYKGIDNYSLFAVQAYGLNEVQGAQVSALSAWVRPVAAVAAGLTADRLSPSRVSAACFALLVGAYASFALATPSASTLWVLYANVLTTCAAVFALRGVYFALFQEAQVPLAATGTAVGFVSVIGYTPDVFVNLLAGVLLDRSPGLAGHRHVFVMLGAFALIGLVASLAFGHLVRERRRGRLQNAHPRPES